MRTKYIARIIKHGNSYVVTVPKLLREVYELKQGDIVEIDLKKIKRDVYD